MPALFSVALAPALHDLQRELRPTEQVLAYLDDVYILASPDRVALLYRRLEDLIWQRARLRLNASKTRVWNAAGVLPDAVPQLAPDSAVWVGDTALSPEQRGLVALGVPLGSPAFIESHLQQSLARHAGLLQTLPATHDTQISWLLLSCCAAPRAQYALRSVAILAQDHFLAQAILAQGFWLKCPRLVLNSIVGASGPAFLLNPNRLLLPNRRTL